MSSSETPGRPGRGLEWYVARRYLSPKSGGLFSFITWIALGGVTVGVSALVVVIGVMAGMQEDLMGKILESTPHVIVQQRGTSIRMDDWRTISDRIREITFYSLSSKGLWRSLAPITSCGAQTFARSTIATMINSSRSRRVHFPACHRKTSPGVSQGQR